MRAHPVGDQAAAGGAKADVWRADNAECTAGVGAGAGGGDGGAPSSNEGSGDERLIAARGDSSSGTMIRCTQANSAAANASRRSANDRDRAIDRPRENF